MEDCSWLREWVDSSSSANAADLRDAFAVDAADLRGATAEDAVDLRDATAEDAVDAPSNHGSRGI